MSELITRKINYVLVTPARAPVRSFETREAALSWADAPSDAEPDRLNKERYGSLILRRIIVTEKVQDLAEILAEPRSDAA